MVFIGGWGSPVGRTDDQIFTTYGASDSYRIVASVDYVFGFTNAIYWQDLYVQRIQQGSSPSINDPTWKIREGERRTYYNSMFEFEGTYDMKSGPGAGELRLRDGTALSKLEMYQNASVQHTYWISDPKVVVNGDTVDYGQRNYRLYDGDTNPNRHVGYVFCWYNFHTKPMGGGYYYDHLWSLKGFYIMFKTDSAAETIYNSFCVDESAFKVALKYNAVIASWFSSPVPT